MKTPEQDPYDRIEHQKKEPDLVTFTKGEIAFWSIFCFAILTGIIVGAVKAISLWLDLP